MRPATGWLVPAALVLAGCVSPQLSSEPLPLAHEPALVRVASPGPVLRVMTLNLAHGRGTGLHQALQGAGGARENLDEVASVLAREAPDLVALQEADGPSSWSGDFDHVAHVARATGMGHGVRGRHARGYGLDYGTALLSSFGLEDAAVHTFRPGPVEPPKGFTVATLRWPGDGRLVDVVSVHLEPLRGERRRRQAAELASVLQRRARPLVLMGDFNTEWTSRDGVLEDLSTTLGLAAYSPNMVGADTYPRLGRRLDWILVSREFEFLEYRVLQDPLSDHRAVVAAIGLREPGELLVGRPGPGERAAAPGGVAPPALSGEEAAAAPETVEPALDPRGRSRTAPQDTGGEPAQSDGRRGPDPGRRT